MFISKDGQVIELLEPLGEDSPIQGFLRKNPGGGLIHIALDVPNLDAAIQEVVGGGGRLITGPVADVAFDQRPIAFVFVGGQVVELVEEA
jgi:methylmalonyl-CoA/ethylmalonyl-CoA epimerase